VELKLLLCFVFFRNKVIPGTFWIYRVLFACVMYYNLVSFKSQRKGPWWWCKWRRNM
jgi:hypothetical protein